MHARNWADCGMAASNVVNLKSGLSEIGPVSDLAATKRRMTETGVDSGLWAIGPELVKFAINRDAR